MKQKGITLIALVITIIVLLILTGVILKAIVRDNGILSKAESTVIESDTVQAKELIQSELARRMDKDGLYTNIDVIDAVKQVTDNYVEEMAEETTTKKGNSFSIADLWVPTEIELPEIPDDVPFIPVESEDDDMVFDISKGNITIGKEEGYEGTNLNGNISKGTHQDENKYYITQSINGMIRDVTIKELMGKPIHMDDLVISNKGIETPTLPENPTPPENLSGEPGPNDIVFDISRGSIKIGESFRGYYLSDEYDRYDRYDRYDGYDRHDRRYEDGYVTYYEDGYAINYDDGYVRYYDDGRVTGTHRPKNRYWIAQSDPVKTANTITFTQDSKELYTVVLDNVNMGMDDRDYRKIEPNTTPGVNSMIGGQILIYGCAYKDGYGYISGSRYRYSKNVCIELKGENIVRSIGYNANVESTYYNALEITSYYGKGSTKGKLYIPEKKVTQEEIKELVEGNTDYNRWNAGIGGYDNNGGDYVKGLTITGGDIQVLTSLGDNCTAIGGGGNNLGEVTIKGGKIKAITNGTGSAIGGGIGWGDQGGEGRVTIEGGEVYAENYGIGTAIGGGSSYNSVGSIGTVEIKGGNVIAKSVTGTAIGGGSSEKRKAGKGQIIINGGTVTANAVDGVAIGGGSAKSYTTTSYYGGDGGDCEIEINGGIVTAISTKNVALGGGESDKGKGGDTKVTITRWSCEIYEGWWRMGEETEVKTEILPFIFFVKQHRS